MNNLRDGNKTLTNKSFDPTDLIQELGKDFLNELRDTYGIDTSFTIDSEITNNQHDESQDTDSDDESNFFDTFEDPESLLEAETKVKQVKINEINSLKKKILAIGSKKSSLRLSLVITKDFSAPFLTSSSQTKNIPSFKTEQTKFS